MREKVQGHGSVPAHGAESSISCEDWHRAMFENNPHPMWIYDLETLKFLAVNDAAIYHYGYPRGCFLEMTIKDIRPQEDVPALLDNVSRVTEGLDDAGVWRHRKKDGTVIDVEIISHTITFSGRRAEVVLVSDITERRSAEASKRELERRYKKLVDTARDVIITFSTERIITSANTAAETITGWKLPELIGKEFTQFVHPDDILYSVEVFQRVLEASPLPVGSLRIKTAAGNYIEVEFTAGLLNANTDSGKREMLCVARDVTGRKEAEEEIKKNVIKQDVINALLRLSLQEISIEELFERALESVLSIPWKSFLPKGAVFTVENEPEMLVMRAQRGLLDEVCHKCSKVRFGECMCGQSALTKQPLFASAVDERHTTAYEGISPHGHYCIPIITREKILGVINMYLKPGHAYSQQDLDFLMSIADTLAGVLERKRVEKELQQAYSELRETQAMVMQQDRLQSLGQMASGIAHDINNALSPISGFVELLLDTETDLNERTKQYLNYIRTAADDVAHTVVRMREFYRKRDGQEGFAAVDLNPIAEQVIDITRPRWRDIPQEKGVTVYLQKYLERNIPLARGNESEIREALTNLIFNAVDAMIEGGSIGVKTGMMDADKVYIEVTDTGSGMDEETRRRCIEPFFTTKDSHGTGLGLSMVYGIMSRHEGDIQIESEKGKGTLMRLVFPAVSSEEKQSENEPENARTHEAYRVLYVDDEPMLRQLVMDMLKSDGHSADSADGGAHAITLLDASFKMNVPYDIVITDLGMPVMDGRELTLAIKKKYPEMPVIMLTGWGQRIRDEENMPDNVDAVLSKPPKLSELRKALARVKRR